MNERDKIVLSSACFPPIAYCAILEENENIIIDTHEHFIKQTYRNRYYILGANGLMHLSIPLQKWSNHTSIKDIQIDYTEDWQKQHWRSILSAYGNSPFFEFYQDELLPLFEQKQKFLLDWDNESLELLQSLLGLSSNWTLSQKYVEKNEADMDLRDAFSPKSEFHHPKIKFHFEEYPQVFNDRFDFQPNLSVLDLLFNLGPETAAYLKSCITQS